MAAAMERRIVTRTEKPNQYTAKTTAGISAMSTSSMMRRVELCARTWGDRDTVRLLIWISPPFYCFLRRAWTWRLQTRMDEVMLRFAGQT